MKRPDLPVFYYHDHFEMLSFVRTTYGPILTDEHDTFVSRFQSRRRRDPPQPAHSLAVARKRRNSRGDRPGRLPFRSRAGLRRGRRRDDGGWASGDRITEIGAVKIRNHQVVDEWHSLVNPQRSIPAKITQITGITNEMVRGAPIFAEVADSFMRFMGDGIFVAHNVNFDYGFISREYERLDRRFRFPKLCTVARMRRRYPGHKSYGLGKLCQLYGIELETHHRALCDARATGYLLNLMNLKREGCEPDRTEKAA